jgi:PelA/Pel-15E family pectate lyase
MKERTVAPSTVLSLSLLLTSTLGGAVPGAQQPDAALREEALKGLRKAATFYRGKVASRGGYVYYYAPDLKERWGEGKTSPDTIFVQPPGTPTVGRAYLRAYAATGDPFYLDAARETAESLVYGQLESGGWTQVIHFDQAKQVDTYRNSKGGSRNVSSLDDGQTQAALQMLIHADRALDFKHAKIHEAALYGLEALIEAQFANGAFPQVWTGPVDKKPIVKATFPDYDWKTGGRIKDYWNYYTLNDNLTKSVADTLTTAHQVYKDEKYKVALEKLGDFLILAQMPEPQPGWCQQYNFDMVPIWARKFEPPALTGWESQGVMETLIKISQFTGEKKYLEPIPSALAYYRKCLLPDGRIARYYEFKTNKPMYMDAKYQLTYRDSAAPSHAYQDVKAGRDLSPSVPAQPLEDDVRKILRELDEQGRWITTYRGERLVGQPKFSDGFRYISSEVFSRNVETLSEYVASAQPNRR